MCFLFVSVCVHDVKCRWHIVNDILLLCCYHFTCVFLAVFVWHLKCIFISHKMSTCSFSVLIWNRIEVWCRRKVFFCFVLYANTRMLITEMGMICCFIFTLFRCVLGQKQSSKLKIVCFLLFFIVFLYVLKSSSA